MPSQHLRPSTLTQMGLEMITLNGVSQAEKGKYHMSHICRIKTIGHMNLFIKHRFTDVEDSVMVTKRGGERGKLEGEN